MSSTWLRLGTAVATVCAAAAACSSSGPAEGPHGAAGQSGYGGVAAEPSEGGASGRGDGGASGEVALGGAGAGAGGENEAGAGGDLGTAGEAPVGPPAMLEVTGDVTDVHDPQIIEEDGVFYLFSTGQGIQVRASTDLRTWQEAGQVFASKPSWITTTSSQDPNLLWAPEVRYFGGKYHLYYAASSFGSQNSCIGHATRMRLDSDEAWVDQGSALICSNNSVNYNAIDGSPFVDPSGNAWLAFGSFWSGLKMIRLDADGRRDGPDLFALATRKNSAVEAPHLHYREGFFYLFESVDSCCQGSNSTYKIMVGRSATVTGPYVDKLGTPLTTGGGTLILEGDARWRGPGHSAVLTVGARDYNVYHSYDSEHGGVPTLRIADLRWGEDGWPYSAGP